MRAFIISYNPNSQSAANLSRSLGLRRIRHNNSQYRYRPGDVFLNWGIGSNIPESIRDILVNARPVIRNTREAVVDASNKLNFFERIQGLGLTPDYTTEIDVARQWIRSGEIVVCRTVLSGHSGNGIVVAENEDQLVPAPLYVLYVKKQEEFRIHVCRPTGVFDTQRKARRHDFENPNWRVRNHASGFIYQRNDYVLPHDAEAKAIQAFEATELDWGAVDIIWNRHQNRSYVLEINTAPGLEGTTLTNYVNMIRDNYL